MIICNEITLCGTKTNDTADKQMVSIWELHITGQLRMTFTGKYSVYGYIYLLLVGISNDCVSTLGKNRAQ